MPDFSGRTELIDVVLESGPEVSDHNVERVPRIFRRIQPGFRYECSLRVIRYAADAGFVTKSNLILGLGEDRGEVVSALRDLLGTAAPS